MATINKVTTLRSSEGVNDEQIQVHLDEQNTDAWTLLAVDNLGGWYRFFWSKVVE